MVVSPWPDRFGRVGNSAVDPFWVDERAPHHFIWQEDPRKIVSGSNGNEVHYGLGYVLAYWMGRRSGFARLFAPGPAVCRSAGLRPSRCRE